MSSTVLKIVCRGTGRVRILHAPLMLITSTQVTLDIKALEVVEKSPISYTYLVQVFDLNGKFRDKFFFDEQPRFAVDAAYNMAVSDGYDVVGHDLKDF